MRIFNPVQNITEARNDPVQSVVTPGSRPEEMHEILEIELAIISELGEESDCDRSKQ